MLTRRAVALMALLLWTAQASAWEVYRVHPFIECDADELGARLRRRAEAVSLSGLQNDWVHAAVGIAVTGEERATVTVSLEGEAAVTGHVRPRVVGFVSNEGRAPSLDAVLDKPGELDLARYSRYMRNLEDIHSFPTVTATKRDPVLLWLTADTRGLPPGVYEGALGVSGGGQLRRIPVRLRVRPCMLPADNPLITQGWQWIPKAPTKEDGARLLFDYGINATHVYDDMEAARAAGFRFFMFTFPPSWKGQPPDQANETEVDEQIVKIQAMIAKLKLRPEEWALYTIDEPGDKTVPTQVQWARHVRGKWPEARFLYNPGWNGDAYNPQQTTEGTIRPLLECADVWLPYSWWVHSSVRPGALELMKSGGKPVWFYEIMDTAYNRRRTVGRDMLRLLAWVAAKHDLQGASFYSLNAYAKDPWAANPTGEYGCMYYTIPARGLEALRQGIVEYKRVYELRMRGVGEDRIQQWAARALRARTVGDIDEVRREMDDTLVGG